MNVSAEASNCDRRTAVSGYFYSLITAHSALFTSFYPHFPALQSSPPTSPRLRRSRRLLPAGRSSPTAVSGASHQKQIPSSQPRNIAFFTLALLAALSGPSLRAETPTGRTQRLNSPEQTPEGLSRSDWQSIRAAYEAGRHAFQPVAEKDGHWLARNPGQQWTTDFDGRGFLATPQGGDWTWGLELRSYGVGEMQTTVGSDPLRVKAGGQRLSYDWDATVQEWWGQRPARPGARLRHRRAPEFLKLGHVPFGTGLFKVDGWIFRI